MTRYASSAMSSLVAAVLGLIFVSATTLAAGDKSANVEASPIVVQHLLPQSEAAGVNRHQRSQRAMSLSHKYAGLGRRSSSDINNYDDETGSRGGASDADALFDENVAKFEGDNSRESSAVLPASNGRRNDDNKRALPSSLRYTGLGKRRAGVSAAMRYAGLGKRIPESSEHPETAVENIENNKDEGSELEVMAAAQQHIDDSDHQQILDRRRRFAVDMLDDVEDVDDEDDDATEGEAVLYGIKRQLSKAGKPRIGVGMRYVGVGKRVRPVMNSRGRVDAGMRYMGIGRRSSY